MHKNNRDMLYGMLCLAFGETWADRSDKVMEAQKYTQIVIDCCKNEKLVSASFFVARIKAYLRTHELFTTCIYIYILRVEGYPKPGYNTYLNRVTIHNSIH